jgi:hypothetical protein
MLHANCMLMRGAGYTVPGAFRQTARPICPSISSDIVNEPKAGLAGRLQLAKLQVQSLHCTHAVHGMHAEEPCMIT